MDSVSIKTWSCFVCTDQVEISSDQDTFVERQFYSSSTGGWFCLKGIFNYLQFSPFEDPILSEEDSVVPLCDKCADVVKPLSNLCQELELTRMRIKGLLESFSSLLASNPTENGGSLVLSRIRKKTKERCLEEIQNSMPRVLLERKALKPIRNASPAQLEHGKSQEEAPAVSLNDKMTLVYEPMDDDSDEASICSDSPVNIQNNNTPEVTNLPKTCNLQDPLADNQLESLDELISLAFDENETEKPSSLNSSVDITPVFNCQFCGSTFDTNDLLTEHILNTHQGERDTVLQLISNCSKTNSSFSSETPSVSTSSKPKTLLDEKLSSSKLAIITTRKFEILCTKVVRAEVSKFRKVIKPSNKSSKHFDLECFYCFAHLGNSNMAQIHLMNKHPNELNAKIVEAQKEEASGMFRCSECPVAFTVKVRLSYHLAYVHPQILLPVCKLEHTSQDLFRQHCKNLVEGELRLLQRMAKPNKALFRCHYCSTCLMDTMHAAYHLITEHYAEIKVKLVGLQNSGEMEEKETTVGLIVPQVCLFEEGDTYAVPNFSGVGVKKEEPDVEMILLDEK